MKKTISLLLALGLALAQAELTGAVAFVGQVDVQRALVFVSDGHNLLLLSSGDAHRR